MRPDYKEIKIQKEVISLLKNLGYKYLSPEETEILRNGNMREVLLKPILREQLMKMNRLILELCWMSFSTNMKAI